MTNRGAWSTTINPGGSVTIPAGYHSGGGRVSASSAPSVESQLRTQTLTSSQTLSAGQDRWVTFTFNNLSKVVGVTKIFKNANSGGYSNYQGLHQAYSPEVNPFTFSGNRVSLYIKSNVDTTSTATWGVTAIGI